jgi:tetratricopeptide (TPR) repeat protein
MMPSEASGLEERAARMRELLARDRADEVVWFGLGQTLLALGRPAEAVDALREAVRLRPDYTAAHRDLGRALLESGRPDEAAHALERAAQVAEETRDLQTGREIAVLRARAATRGGQGEAKASAAPDSARTRSRAAAPSGTASQSALQLAREALRQLGNDRLERATALYERALEADPQLALAWNGLSVAWRLRGDLERAIEAARRLVELEPDDPLSHTNLSILYQARGMIPEAEDEKAIAMRLQLRSRT